MLLVRDFYIDCRLGDSLGNSQDSPECERALVLYILVDLA